MGALNLHSAPEIPLLQMREDCAGDQAAQRLNEPSRLELLPEVLTTREGARFLRCSKAHFCNLLNGRVRGVPPLPSLQVGRRRLVRKKTLIEWIAAVESAGATR